MLQPARKMLQEMVGQGIPHCKVGYETEGGQEGALGCPSVAEETRQQEEEGSQVTSQDQLHFQSLSLCIDDAPGQKQGSPCSTSAC